MRPRVVATQNARISVEAEQALLGILLSDTSALERVRPFLRASHFSEGLYARIYDAFQEEYERGSGYNPAAIATRFIADPVMLELGGLEHIGLLMSNAPPSENAVDYGKAVYDSAVRTEVAAICAAGLQAATEGTEEAFGIVSQTRQKLELLESEAATDDDSLVEATDVADHAIAVMQDKAVNGRARGLLTGLRCFDRRMNGLKAGALIVIGARPGMGKTGLLRAAFHGAAIRNPDFLFPLLNLEMDGVDIMQRELSSLCYELGENIPYQAMDAGKVTPFDFSIIAQARQKVPRNLILDNRCARLSVDSVRRKIWALSRRGRIGAIGIDYLQLMQRPAAEGRNEASVIGEMTRGLKQAARETGTCIVLLSQLSRSVESRDNKKPQLSDLKESGAIEADADAVLLPFRPYYYHLKDEPAKSDLSRYQKWETEGAIIKRRLEVYCAKQRGGPEGLDLQTYVAECDHIEDSHE